MVVGFVFPVRMVEYTKKMDVVQMHFKGSASLKFKSLNEVNVLCMVFSALVINGNKCIDAPSKD